MQARLVPATKTPRATRVTLTIQRRRLAGCVMVGYFVLYAAAGVVSTPALRSGAGFVVAQEAGRAPVKSGRRELGTLSCPVVYGRVEKMPRRLSVVLSLWVSVALLISTLAVCNAHLPAEQHPDCGQCLAAAASRRDDGPPIPTGPHHCSTHPCAHLHAPFLPIQRIALPSPTCAARLFSSSPTLQGHDLLPPLLKPPQV